jgi:hypothetical protein
MAVVSHPWPVTSKSNPITVRAICRAIVSQMTPIGARHITYAYGGRITVVVIIGRDRVSIVIAVIIVGSAVSIAVIGRR